MNLLLVAALSMLMVTSAGTPQAAAQATFPHTPNPEECLVDPRAPEALAVILATPTPPGATPLNRLPAGNPAPADVEREVADVIVELFACLNGGDSLRSFALYSDDYLRQILPNIAVESLAGPEPADHDEWTTIIDIHDVRTLPDGRVAATVLLDPALIPVDKIFVFILIEQEGRWLIDDVLDELEFSLP